jgi:AcrR family transcriptional regulator
MSSYSLSSSDWPRFHLYILQLEQEGLVTRTFRRLDPSRQEVIINAILDEAALRGPASLNIKLVAQRAGISVGSLYQYFIDRDRMLSFAVELCVRYVIEQFDQYRPYLAEMPLREALTAYLMGGIEWGRTQTGFLQLFARAAYQGEQELAEKLVTPIAKYLLETVREMLAQAQARGEIRPDVDLESMARIIHALTIVIGDSQLLPYLNDYFQVTDPSLEPERILQSLLDLVQNGIGAPPQRETQPR